MPIFQEALEEHITVPHSHTSTNTASHVTRHASHEMPDQSLTGPVDESSMDWDQISSAEHQLQHNHHVTSQRDGLIQRLKRDIHTAAAKPSIARQSKPQPLHSDALHGVTKSPDDISTGTEIARPRSALHSGDFTQQTRSFQPDSIDHSPLYDPPSPSWFATSPPRDFAILRHDAQPSTPAPQLPFSTLRHRAPSLSSSLSSTFAFKAPTSPLVHSESNDELDDETFMHHMDITSHPQPNSRRHTLQGHGSLRNPSSLSNSSAYTRPSPTNRRTRAHPYQAHQPRRSITLTSDPTFRPSTSLTSTPTATVRRPSFTLDNSPSARTSMVGSYEESILRGRMSTAPSRPLIFVADIGVLGIGKCKPQLRCPPHVTLSFPAVFYSYATTSHDRGHSLDGPSPYVGQIDLENDLDDPSSKLHSTQDSLSKQQSRSMTEDHDENTHHNINDRARHRSTRTPPGGCYRIPQKGQLQIIIKNPNKTAVKLFLIPYDLMDMQPGTKTFLRQRSYSTGPIIDMPLSAARDLESSMDKPTLRYLIHVHICCTARNRFYLYRSIRVVFANRVPDGKERLHNSIQLPEPKYSPYRPERQTSTSMTSNSITSEKVWRRRSSGYATGGGSAFMEGPGLQDVPFGFDGTESSPPRTVESNAKNMRFPAYKDTRGLDDLPHGINFQDGALPVHDVTTLSPTSSFSDQSRPSTAKFLPDVNMGGPSNAESTWSKLDKDDDGYGIVSKRLMDTADSGLLAREIRGLGIWKDRSPF